MPLEVNALESARFKIVAARVTDPAASLASIEAAAREKGVDMAMVRLPVADLSRVRDFEEAGYRLMDTLLYYARDLEQGDFRAEPKKHGICRRALPQDADAVAAIARAGFGGYIGHYHSDPRLDSASADEAYVDWAHTSTSQIHPCAPVLVAETGDGIVGFLTLRENDATTMEIVLNAVHPAHSGKGLYHALVCEVLALASERGMKQVITSTQINNYAPQRVWSRLGFYHHHSLYTFHKWF